MNDLQEYKQKLTDLLSDEYSFSKQYNDLSCMSLIEDIFKKLDLDFKVIEFINKEIKND